MSCKSCILKEVLITDITMLFPDGKTRFLYPDHFKNLVIADDGSTGKVIAENVNSFDAECSSKNGTEVFISTDHGTLLYISHDGERLLSRTMMTAKNVKSKIREVSVIEINGRYHVFYCLDCERRYLIHQIVSDGDFCEPAVIDSIGRHFAYSIAKDEECNIHIVYETDSRLKYRKYAYSQKNFTAPLSLFEGEVGKTAVGSWQDNVYVAFTEPGRQVCRLFLARVSDTPSKKLIMSADKDSDISLNCMKEGIVVHVTAGGVCYEIESDYSLNVKKPKSIGKSYGICRIRSSLKNNTVRSFPVNRAGLPRDGYVGFSSQISESSGAFAPKGDEIVKFAQEHKKAFGDKLWEVINEDIILRLARIEDSVAKLTACVEETLSEIKNEETPSS